MAQKPPAFQFYTKDWLTSPTVLRMTDAEQGLYCWLLAAAWNSDEPGTLPLPISMAAKVGRIDPRKLRYFLLKYPTTFIERDGLLVNEKLHAQWLELREHLDLMSGRGRKGAEARWGKRDASSIEQALPKNGSALASASASALATSKTKTTPPTPPRAGGTESFIRFAGETIAVQMGHRKRLLTQVEMAALVGGRAEDMVAALIRKGFKARILPGGQN